MSAGARQRVAIQRFAILGAGAMGSLVGGGFCLGGADVTLLDVNAEHVDAVKRSGLRITLDDGEHVVRPAAMRPNALQDPPDLVVVLTKQLQTRAALSSIRRVLDAGPWVLSLQNGLGNQEIIEEIVPRERILLGVTTYPADLLGPAMSGRTARVKSG